MRVRISRYLKARPSLYEEDVLDRMADWVLSQAQLNVPHLVIDPRVLVRVVDRAPEYCEFVRLSEIGVGYEELTHDEARAMAKEG